MHTRATIIMVSTSVTSTGFCVLFLVSLLVPPLQAATGLFSVPMPQFCFFQICNGVDSLYNIYSFLLLLPLRRVVFLRFFQAGAGTSSSFLVVSGYCSITKTCHYLRTYSHVRYSGCSHFLIVRTPLFPHVISPFYTPAAMRVPVAPHSHQYLRLSSQTSFYFQPSGLKWQLILVLFCICMIAKLHFADNCSTLHVLIGLSYAFW